MRQHGPRNGNVLIMCVARRTSDNGFKKRLAEAVRDALVDVRGTHVTRAGGKSVTCTYAALHVVSACSPPPKKNIRRSYLHYEFLNFAYIFARRQHAVASTAGCGRGFGKTQSKTFLKISNSVVNMPHMCLKCIAAPC